MSETIAKRHDDDHKNVGRETLRRVPPPPTSTLSSPPQVSDGHCGHCGQWRTGNGGHVRLGQSGQMRGCVFWGGGVDGGIRWVFNELKLLTVGGGTKSRNVNEELMCVGEREESKTNKTGV